MPLGPALRAWVEVAGWEKPAHLVAHLAGVSDPGKSGLVQSLILLCLNERFLGLSDVLPTECEDFPGCTLSCLAGDRACCFDESVQLCLTVA